MYIESICNDCHRLIANELKFIALHPELLDYVDIKLHIFGKAHIEDAEKGIVTCQFGERGCEGNRALNCVNKYASSFTESIQVMECLFEVQRYTGEAIEMCAAKFGASATDAVACLESDEANNLLIEAGYSTPPLRWVPSFYTGSGVRIDTRNLVKDICGSISGKLPDCCFSTKYTVGMDAEL